ncbi:ATPase [Atopomonas sediminilitoris]|uniref:ATPase n=1 Tax=Atopomonas sediminilitoris TaxID=2919919 RepID=UPI001F4E3DA2|nr:ATPase [Atopomonas sediminilitoris]MCJ8168703.1 ATPase [Atopomonas sediminilitoris]
MRNDADDELTQLPSLRATDDEPAALREQPAAKVTSDTLGMASSMRGNADKPASTAPIWVLVAVLAVVLTGLGWWSFQQIVLLQRQLVATQESFARISEEAAGRLQEVSGKVVATESSVTSESEAVKLRVKQLETQLANVQRQQQVLSEQQKQTAQQSGHLQDTLKQQQSEQATVQTALANVSKEQTAQSASLQKLLALEPALAALQTEVQRVAKASQNNAQLQQVQDDLLILRSELETRTAQNESQASLDAFRQQVTANITTLQTQLRYLQQQLPPQ